MDLLSNSSRRFTFGVDVLSVIVLTFLGLPMTGTAGSLQHAGFGNVQAVFEPNRGQLGDDSVFIIRARGYFLALNGSELKIAQVGSGGRPVAGAEFGVRFLGGNPGAQAEGIDPTGGVSNYFLGNDPEAWIPAVPHYRGVRFREVYPGVSLEYRTDSGAVEFELVLAPRIDLDQVRIQVIGPETARIGDTGDLVLGDDLFRLRCPAVVTRAGEEQRSARVEFEIREPGVFGFRVRGHNPELPLVIDPVLVSSTYLGGGLEDLLRDVAVDAQGRAVILGKTSSFNFPVSSAVYPVPPGGGCYRTFDGGGHWSPIKSGLGAGKINALAMGPGPVRTLYAAMDNVGVFRSVDLGDTWSLASPVGSQALSKVRQILPSPDGARVYAVGTEGVAVTADHGATWTLRNSGLPLDSYGRITEIRQLAVDPDNPSVLLAGLEIGGIYRSADAGDTWRASNQGLADTQKPVYGFAYLSGAPRHLFAATRGAGLLRSEDSGQTWQTTTLSGPARWVAASPAAPGTLYVLTIGTANYDLSQSTDRGATWLTAYASQSIEDMVADPQDAGVVYFMSRLFGLTRITCVREKVPGAPERLKLSQNSIGSGISGFLANAILTLVIDPDDSRRMWVGTEGESNIFVTKLNQQGTALEFSTYLGGIGAEDAGALALDAAGRIYIAGWTSSRDFPIRQAYQPTFGGGVDDAFLAGLSADGSSLLFSTYLGGSSVDRAQSIALGESGDLYLTGYTESSDFPRVNPLQGIEFVKSRYAFASRFAAGGQILRYSTFLGGSAAKGTQEYGARVLVAANGEAVVAGVAGSTDFPVVNPFQRYHGGGDTDGFVSRLSADGRTLLWSSYLGGSGYDRIYSAVLASDGKIWLTGHTNSPNFPVKDGMQSALQGSYDGFVTVLAADGRSIQRSTYFGGTGYDVGQSLVVDGGGAILLAGDSDSTDLPLASPDALSNPAGSDLFLVRFQDSSMKQEFTTWVGGNRYDYSARVAPGPGGRVVVGGSSRFGTADLPTTNWWNVWPMQHETLGQDDSFIAYLDPHADLIFPRYQETAQQFTAFAVSNPFDHPVELEFTAYGPTGSPLMLPANPASVILPANAQLASFGKELLGAAGPVGGGWLKLRSDTMVGAFTLGGGLSGPPSLDGAVALTGRHDRLWFTRIYEGVQAFLGRNTSTTLHVVNPGETAARVRMALKGNAGAALASDAVRTIPARGVMAETITQLFGSGIKVTSGYVALMVESGPEVSGYSWITLSSGSALGLNATPGNPLRSGYSAQLGSGLGFFTSIRLVNTSSARRTVTLRPRAEDGSLLVTPVWRTDLEPGAALEQMAGTLFGLPAGDLVVGSLDCSFSGDGVVGDVVFGAEDGRYAAAMQLQYRPIFEAVFSQVANTPPFFTGLAVYNSSPSANDITIEVYRLDGSLAAHTLTPVRLLGFRRFSSLLPELLPETAGQIRGYVVVRSTQGIATQQLFGDGNSLAAIPPTVFR